MSLMGGLFEGEMIYNLMFFGIMVFAFVWVMKINLKEKVIEGITLGKDKILKRDAEISRRKEQLRRVGSGEKGWKKKYNDLIQGVIIAFRIKGMSVENFTTILFLITAGICSFLIIFFESVILGVMLSIPTFFGIVAVILFATKNMVRKNEEAVMDALDTICPSIDQSINSAIEKNLPSFDISIRADFAEFIYVQNNSSYHFNEAIVELNKKLGPVFNSFAEKAITFYEIGEEGMNEIFQDIVEQNGIRREMNIDKDIKSKKFMSDLLASCGILIGFLGFLYVAPLSADLISNTAIGKFVSALTVSILMITIAVNLLTQVTFDERKGKEQ